MEFKVVKRDGEDYYDEDGATFDILGAGILEVKTNQARILYGIGAWLWVEVPSEAVRKAKADLRRSAQRRSDPSAASDPPVKAVDPPAVHRAGVPYKRKR